jgi:hypothetical protein
MDNTQLIQNELTKRKVLEQLLDDVYARRCCTLQGKDYVEPYIKFINNKLDLVDEAIKLLTINSEESLRTAEILIQANGWSSELALYLIRLGVLKF